MDDVNVYAQKGIELVMEYGPKVILAIVVLLVGLWIIGRVVKMTCKVMEKRQIDASLKGFLSTLISVILKILLIISVVDMLGVETTSFVAILAASGLAVGLALQGTLANFAGGVLILLFKPFKVGDVIKAQGHIGKVEEIQIFVTILRNAENRKIIQPNGVLSNGDITNLTDADKVRVDMTFGISYDSNIKVAKDVLLKVMGSHPLALQDPAPFVGVTELADSSVNFTARVFTAPGDYWAVFFDCMENGKVELEAAGISIPFPQVDVHMDK